MNFKVVNKIPQKNPARFARLVFGPKSSGKHTSAAFGPTIRESENFSSCFFFVPVFVAARSAAKFPFCLWDFSSERSQNEDRGARNLKISLDFQSGRFARGF